MCNGGYACSWLPVTHGRPFPPLPGLSLPAWMFFISSALQCVNAASGQPSSVYSAVRARRRGALQGRPPMHDSSVRMAWEEGRGCNIENRSLYTGRVVLNALSRALSI